MAKFETKIKQVENYLRAGHSITQKEAIELFSAYRLSSIIFTLRQTMPIETRLVQKGDARFAEYTLLIKPNNKQIKLNTI